jgi:hypothetical protein
LPLPQRLQDLEATPPRQHQIEDDQIERFGVGLKETVLTRDGDGDVVVLRLQGCLEHLSEFPLVFDDQHTHD